MGDTANPYGLSDRTMEWIRERAKRDVEASVARARQQLAAAAGATHVERGGGDRVARLERARAVDAEQVRLGERDSDETLAAAMWEAFEEAERV